MSTIIDKIDQEQIKQDVTPFNTGDTVRVHTRVIEGDKERIQIFAGIVIARKGSGLHKAFTVRRISYGEGVERVFPLYSPRVAKVEVMKKGSVRRSRLHYLRGRKGKEAIQEAAFNEISDKLHPLMVEELTRAVQLQFGKSIVTAVEYGQKEGKDKEKFFQAAGTMPPMGSAGGLGT